MSRSSPRERPQRAPGTSCAASRDSVVQGPVARALRGQASGVPPRSGTDRAQTEPLAALVALLAVCSALTLYATVAADAPQEADAAVAAPAMERLAATAVTDGTVSPDAVPDPATIVRGGRRARITLAHDGRVRAYGPEPPSGADRATRPVSVAVRPGVRRPGRLTVEVWT